MITEDYCGFEVAKLLKEKGFDGDTNCYYIEGTESKNLCYSPIRKNHNKRITNDEFDIHIDIGSSRISAPTLQMAMKWLRREHNIHIEILMTNHSMSKLFDIPKYYWVAVNAKTCKWITESTLYSAKQFDTKEEACEAAIKYCLENLI